MADEAGKTEEGGEKKIVHAYPLVKHTDMVEEMRNETIELTITACEKYSSNYEHAARVIKETMDKKFGTYWHVVVGEGFGFEEVISGVTIGMAQFPPKHGWSLIDMRTTVDDGFLAAKVVV